MISGMLIVQEYQINFAIAQEAVELKCQIAVSVKPLHEDELAVAADNEFALSAWRLNFELQSAAALGRDLNCRRRAECSFCVGGVWRCQGCQQDDNERFFQ